MNSHVRPSSSRASNERNATLQLRADAASGFPVLICAGRVLESVTCSCLPSPQPAHSVSAHTHAHIHTPPPMEAATPQVHVESRAVTRRPPKTQLTWTLLRSTANDWQRQLELHYSPSLAGA